MVGRRVERFARNKSGEETVGRQTMRSHFPACHNIHYACGTMDQIRRLIYNERGIAIVVATVESNYFIVSINCSPARHAFRMLIINERDNASQPSPLACIPPSAFLLSLRSQVNDTTLAFAKFVPLCAQLSIFPMTIRSWKRIRIRISIVLNIFFTLINLTNTVIVTVQIFIRSFEEVVILPNFL